MSETTTDYHPQRWECSNCGYAFFDEDAWDSWYCRHCGDEMEMVAPLGYVDKGDLRELVEKWRNDSDYMDTHRENYKSPGVTELAAEVIDDLADELEGIITDE